MALGDDQRFEPWIADHRFREQAQEQVILERIAADERGSVLFEAPGRVAATLRDLGAACGADRPGAVCREL